MAFNINEFIARGLEFGGARPSLFNVFLRPPAGLGIEASSVDKFTFACQGAQLPAASISQIEVPYFGRRIKVAGERTFDNWTVSIMNDEDFKVRALFEKWSNALNSLEGNQRIANLNEENYKADLEVFQYGKDGAVIRGYRIVGAFPTDISAIDVNWSSTGAIESFNVTFAYDYWEPSVESIGTNQYAQDVSANF